MAQNITKDWLLLQSKQRVMIFKIVGGGRDILSTQKCR